MPKKDLSEYKRRYDMARHHAWAGSILLSVFLAVRIIVGEEQFPDFFVFVIGGILVVYILISLFLTYNYREGLMAKQEKQIIQIESSSDEVEKQRLKVEKKKAKVEAKKVKKQGKK